jgi:putative N6-adenine-specific DNA methylase
MKNQMSGFDCWILSSHEGALKRVGLKPDRKLRVYNGDLECSFRKFAVYEGSKKQRYEQDATPEA